MLWFHICEYLRLVLFQGLFLKKDKRILYDIGSVQFGLPTNLKLLLCWLSRSKFIDYPLAWMLPTGSNSEKTEDPTGMK